jgi:hypothetical protein
MNGKVGSLSGSGNVRVTGEKGQPVATVDYVLWTLRDGTVHKASNVRIEEGILDVGKPYTLELEDGGSVDFLISQPGMDWSKGKETGNAILIQPLSGIRSQKGVEV